LTWEVNELFGHNIREVNRFENKIAENYERG